MHGSGRPELCVLLVVIIASAVACGDEASNGGAGACTSEPPSLPFGPSAEIEGSMNVTDTTVMVGTDAALQSRISGLFQRVVSTGTPAAVRPLGPLCVGTVSRTQLPRVERLSAGPVTVGLDADPTVLQPNDALLYSYFENAVLRLDGVVGVSGEGGGAGTEFPAFQIASAVPEPLTVLEPLTDGTAPVPFGDMSVRWNAGSGQWVLVEIVPDPLPNDGGKVECYFRDTGCGVVPAVATTFLSPAADKFLVSVSRNHAESAQLDDETKISVRVRSTVRFEMTQGEGQ